MRPQGARSIPSRRTASGSRTTAASIARTTRARTGSVSRTTAFRASFGFPIAINHRKPDMAFVIPEDSVRGSEGEVGGGDRVTTGGRLGVYRTEDGGRSWELASNGLPDHAWVEVLREGMASDRRDPVGIYFGTKSGSVFVSPERGRRVDRGGAPPAGGALGRSRRVVTVRVPGLLADQAGGRKEFDVEAPTVRRRARGPAGAGPALRRARRAAPARERLRRRRGHPCRRRVETELSGDETIRVVAAIAGG